MAIRWRRKPQNTGVAAQMHLPGHVDIEEIAYLYRRARMLVFPSLFEGFGIPLVEAMTVGCPIVAAAETSIPEIVGDAAEMFDPRSPAELAIAIERVWKDEARRTELVAQWHHSRQSILAGANSRRPSGCL